VAGASRLLQAREYVGAVENMTDAADVASRLSKAKRSGAGWVACCPAHEDSTPSLSITNGESGRVVVHCHAGCSADSVLDAIEALGVEIRKPKTNGAHHEVHETLTIEDLAAAKGLSIETLRENFVHETNAGVGFIYANADGEQAGTKFRRYLGGSEHGKGFSWAAGSKPSLYGLWRLERDFANDGRLILCEGETDALTLWQHGYTALALPGASMWREEWLAQIPEGAKVYVILEPDQGGRTVEASVMKSELRHRAHFIRMTEATKDPNQLHMTSEAGFVDDFERLITHAESAVVQPITRLNWKRLATQIPPGRQWAIDHWLGMGHVTLLAGAGGTGKTSVAQAMASCLALGRDYLDNVPSPRRVLMWACEDDAQELWRRQIAIAAALGVPLEVFEENFILMPYDGEEVELCSAKDGSITASPMLETLCQQIGDYKADAAILDNIARLYGCNENDRHQVTSFIAMLTKAARPTGAAVLLLGHPAKGVGSEYSGSTAWEGAARSRLYLGRSLPDQEPPEEPKEDDGLRYLCRRKANYSTRDYRRIRYTNGVMVPDDAERPVTARPTEYAQDVVVRAITHLERIGKYGNSSTASPDYLPKLADQYQLLEGIGRKQFASAVRELELAGKLKSEVVGHYPNRAPKKGLKVAP
jgi:hypothetical protein